jgi:hypothetical protein
MKDGIDFQGFGAIKLAGRNNGFPTNIGRDRRASDPAQVPFFSFIARPKQDRRFMVIRMGS